MLHVLTEDKILGDINNDDNCRKRNHERKSYLAIDYWQVNARLKLVQVKALNEDVYHILVGALLTFPISSLPA